jgi:hypothetical protein
MPPLLPVPETEADADLLLLAIDASGAGEGKDLCVLDSTYMFVGGISEHLPIASSCNAEVSLK